MKVCGIDHVNIATSDLAATVAFYVEVLGLLDGYRPPFAVAGHWLYVGDRPLVHIQRVAEPVRPSIGSALNHVALRVADLGAAIDGLKAHGVSHRISCSADGAPHQVFLQDPNGTYLELSAGG